MSDFQKEIDKLTAIKSILDRFADEGTTLEDELHRLTIAQSELELEQELEREARRENRIDKKLGRKINDLKSYRVTITKETDSPKDE